MPVTYASFYETPMTPENNNYVKCPGDIGCGSLCVLICIYTRRWKESEKRTRTRTRTRASSLSRLLRCAAACPAGADLSACEVSLTSAAIKTPRRCTLVKRSISRRNIEDGLVWDLRAVTVWQRNYLCVCNTDSEVTGEDFPLEA